MQTATEILPLEIWVEIAKRLDLEGLKRFITVCRTFYWDDRINNNARKTELWFEEMASQFHGEGENEARVLLRYCFANLDNSNSLLLLLNKLLICPLPHVAAFAEEDDFRLSINKLTRIVYPDPNNNPRQTLIESIKYLTVQPVLNITPHKVIEKDRTVDRWLRYAPLGGLVSTSLGLYNMLTASPSIYRDLLTLLFVAVGVSSITYVQIFSMAGRIETYKYPTFFHKINELPQRERNQLYHKFFSPERYSQYRSGKIFTLSFFCILTATLMLLIDSQMDRVLPPTLPKGHPGP
ncbi:MAG: hypothetical protein M3R00_02690 [Pseudomonadota bacterium]|nr:hypothetical protein [Pseudomonadota bacterium]